MPLSPVNTRYAGNHPVYRWGPLAGATSYRVAVYDDKYIELEKSPLLTAEAWPGTATLQPGRAYLWQVTAHTAAGDITTPVPPRPEARFQLADAAATAAGVELHGRLQRHPLQLGILLAQRGCAEEAAVALARAAEDTATAAGARALLDDLGQR